MSGILTVVGTPLGNLGDMSPRAVEALRQADFIAAEDTRVTLKLLNHFEIKKPMISYFEHNRKFHGELICQKIEAGENCALVSDAGMPAISDPGEDLVRLCGERGITVSVVPGPSALIAAVAVSGLPTGRFTFEGFLSTNKKSRRDHLEQVKNETRTMIFYEAPHKLHACLRDMYAAWGDRRIAVVHELTKIHGGHTHHVKGGGGPVFRGEHQGRICSGHRGGQARGAPGGVHPGAGGGNRRRANAGARDVRV